ncbi:Uma2 family endonuclease [Synechocystis sp. PCC 7509]|uniref:Uma2 family endonuclease n=1 Tax=Synechocystis sp. PCC 7509 TaxID=927677 RepID=UPI0002ACC66C|nr:Uma2 family endonuclease [Synechocystis sp. PCC 7509]
MVLTNPTAKISLDEFLQLPETKPASEYINGQVYQKPMPQGKHSLIQTYLSAAINQISNPQKRVLALTELRCTFDDSAIVPDVTVFEWSRIPLLPDGSIADRFNIPPDWVIEILSPDQSPSRVIRKITFCLNHGTKLGWFIDPNGRAVTVFQPNQTPEFKEGQDILPVLDVVSDWQLSVADLFSFLYPG